MNIFYLFLFLLMTTLTYTSQLIKEQDIVCQKYADMIVKCYNQMQYRKSDKNIYMKIYKDSITIRNYALLNCYDTMKNINE